MRYSELFEAQEITEGHTFFHVTTQDRMKSIMASGLQPPKASRRHRRWRNSFGGLLGERDYIYLISDFTEAVRFAARMDYQHRVNNRSNAKIVILVLNNVPTEGLVRDDHIDGQLAGHTWYKSPANIPPQDIVRVIPLTLELKKQAIVGSNAQLPPEETPA